MLKCKRKLIPTLCANQFINHTITRQDESCPPPPPPFKYAACMHPEDGKSSMTEL